MTILPPDDDHFHDVDHYEWSYLDGLSEDGAWGFVAIWFRGCAMSPWYTAAIDRHRRDPARHPLPDPLEHSAFTFSLYHRGRRRHFVLHEHPGSSFEGSRRSADVAVGRSALRLARGAEGRSGGLATIDTSFGLQASRLVGEIELTFPPIDLSPLIESARRMRTDDRHAWVPAAPAGSFVARLDLWRLGRGVERLRFRGSAYHDRNFGTEPLHDLHCDWFWGRLHAGERSFVYFAQRFEREERPDFSALLLMEGGRLVDHALDVDLYRSARRRHWATLPYSPIVRGISPGGALGFSSQEQRALDQGPFYHRLLSTISVDRHGERFAEGIGITEYLRPDRLGIAPFRPFVKMRARRRPR